jgi:hypothetical protein
MAVQLKGATRIQVALEAGGTMVAARATDSQAISAGRRR